LTNFQDVTNKAKMLATYGLIMLAFTLGLAYNLYNLKQINDQLNLVVESEAQTIKLAARITQNVLEIARAEKNIVLAKNQQEMNVYAAFTARVLDEMLERRELLRELTDTEGKRLLDNFSQVWGQYLLANEQVRELTRINANVKAKILSQTEARYVFEEASRSISALIERNSNEVAIVSDIKNLRVASLSAL
jgi:methyl-accepting chemotaxis protein